MRRPPRAAAYFESFNKQNTSLIVRLDVIEKRLTQLEEEVAEVGRWRKLLTSAPDTGELNRETQYLDAMTTFFNEQEFRKLCFDLRVNYDALPASGLYGKAMELIGYMKRHGRLLDLYEKVREERPFLELS